MTANHHIINYNLYPHKPKSCTKHTSCNECAHYIFNCTGRNSQQNKQHELNKLNGETKT